MIRNYIIAILLLIIVKPHMLDQVWWTFAALSMMVPAGLHVIMNRDKYSQ
jgi:hypothetical protein